MLVRELRESDRRENFRSGEHSLDDFFHRYAWANHLNGISRVFVATEEEEASDVWGYYALSATHVTASQVSGFTEQRLPTYPIPAFLIGKLAVSESRRRQGIGRVLLRHALVRAHRVSREVGAFGVLVHAVNDEVVEFYRRFGFEVMPPGTSPQPMFLPMTTISVASS